MLDAHPVAAVCDRRSKPPAVIDRRYSRFVALPARALSGLIWLYQRTLSPALVVIAPTCGCRFAPTCSHYARTALQEHGLGTGLILTVFRLAKCGPWHPGGEDPVPAARKPVCSRLTARRGTDLLRHQTTLSGRSKTAPLHLS